MVAGKDNSIISNWFCGAHRWSRIFSEEYDGLLAYRLNCTKIPRMLILGTEEVKNFFVCSIRKCSCLVSKKAILSSNVLCLKCCPVRFQELSLEITGSKVDLDKYWAAENSGQTILKEHLAQNRFVLWTEHFSESVRGQQKTHFLMTQNHDNTRSCACDSERTCRRSASHTTASGPAAPVHLPCGSGATVQKGGAAKVFHCRRS
jgi:hypothetical protein